jgi:lipoprotein-releasing system ATP-binding protein
MDRKDGFDMNAHNEDVFFLSNGHISPLFYSVLARAGYFPVDELASFRNQHIGFVFQFHFLLPEFTALKNVMLPAEKLGKYSKSEIEDRAFEKLKLLDMHNFANKVSSKLSGGQAQRVAIARALINDPTIIMGDEPTGNLDTANTRIVFEILRDLAADKGQTIISVTHDPDFAQNSDRIIEMKDGEIIKM